MEIDSSVLYAVIGIIVLVVGSFIYIKLFRKTENINSSLQNQNAVVSNIDTNNNSNSGEKGYCDGDKCYI